MLQITDNAFAYLNKQKIPVFDQSENELSNKTYKKESKTRGFHKKQRWNKSLTVTEKCNFNTILIELDGKICMKNELNDEKVIIVYLDPFYDIAIVFQEENEIGIARRRCRDNVKIKIMKNEETNFMKHIQGYLKTGNFRIFLISTQNIAKDEEIFLSPNHFKKYTDIKDTCTCLKEEFCLYNGRN